MTRDEFAHTVTKMGILLRRVKYHSALARICSDAFVDAHTQPLREEWVGRRNWHMARADGYNDQLVEAEDALLEAGFQPTPSDTDLASLDAGDEVQ